MVAMASAHLRQEILDAVFALTPHIDPRVRRQAGLSLVALLADNENKAAMLDMQALPRLLGYTRAPLPVRCTATTYDVSYREGIVHLDTPPCKIHRDYVWHILQGGGGRASLACSRRKTATCAAVRWTVSHAIPAIHATHTHTTPCVSLQGGGTGVASKVATKRNEKLTASRRMQCGGESWS